MRKGNSPSLPHRSDFESRRSPEGTGLEPFGISHTFFGSIANVRRHVPFGNIGPASGK